MCGVMYGYVGCGCCNIHNILLGPPRKVSKWNSDRV